MQVGGMILNSLGAALIPRLAKYYAEGRNAAFLNLLAKLLYLALGLGAASVLAAHYFGRTLLTILYRPEYAQYANVFTVLMLAAALSYICSSFGIAVSSARCFAGQFPVNIVSSLLGLICSYFLVARMGLMGAAIAVLVISFAATAGYAVLLLLRLVRPGRGV
jgi:O-antigen/teichoic acid export membrane protein